MSNSDLQQPAFVKEEGDLLYFLQLDDHSVGLNHYCIAYVPSSDLSADTITLADSWKSMDGCYLFLNINKSEMDQRSFVEQFASFMLNPALKGTRMLWISNPGQLPADWLYEFIPVSGLVPSVSRKQSLSLSNYALIMQGGTLISLNEDGNSLVFTNPPGAGNGIYLTAADNTYTIEGIQHDAALSFIGGTAGCFQFKLTLIHAEGGDYASQLDQMGIGLRLFVDNPTFAGYLAPIQYRVFNQSLSMQATIDLINLLAPNRTHLSFVDSGTPIMKRIDVHYRTNNGLPLVLAPIAPAEGSNAVESAPGLVFAISPDTLIPSDQPEYYLVPSGDFAILLGDAASGKSAGGMLCGVSGIEYIRSPGATGGTDGTYIRFHPGQPAYAQGYAAGAAAPMQLNLTEVATTSWAFVANVGGEPARYFSQPEKSPQFTASTDSDSYMYFLELPAGNLSAQDNTRINSFPLFPYVSIIADTLTDAYVLETQLLSRVRRERIYAVNRTFGSSASDSSTALLAASATTQGVTPQGFISYFDGAGNWSRLHFTHKDNSYMVTEASLTLIKANTQLTDDEWQKLSALKGILYLEQAPFLQELSSILSPDHVQTAAPIILQHAFYFANDLWITNVKNTLRAALQTNRLFLVITDCDAFLQNCSIPYLLSEHAFQDLLESFSDGTDGFMAALFQLDASLTGRLSREQQDTVRQLFKSLVNSSYQGNGDGNFFAELQAHNPDIYALLSMDQAGLEPEFTGYQNLAKSLQSLSNVLYESEADFMQAAQGVLTDEWSKNYVEKNKRNKRTLLSAAAFFYMKIEDWTLNLSPYTWGEHGTMLIFKFFDGKSIASLADDCTLWTFGAEFNKGDMPGIQKKLQDLIAAAGKEKIPGLESFIADVVNQDHWEGILALNAYVPLSELPPQMEGIAAGIDPAAFYCHHFGINLSPLQHDGDVVRQVSPACFGLIYYNDPDILSGISDYLFKVLSLQVQFRNSQVVQFASRASLLVNRLFGEPCTLRDLETGGAAKNGNNLFFNGSYQRQNGKASYIFVNESQNLFTLLSNTIRAVEIIKAQFITLPEDAADSSIRTRFLFQGNLHFIPQSSFDMYSFGSIELDSNGMMTRTTTSSYLRYNALMVDMNFDAEIPFYKTFIFDVSQLNFDMASSIPRADSLYANFPLKLKSFVTGNSGITPDNTHYMPIDIPIQADALSDPWYGLQCELNMGSLGALAGIGGFTADFLMAWSPGKDAFRMYMGIKMPGVNGGTKEITLESVLKLTFGDVNFSADVSTGTPNYMLQLKNIALKLFVLTFPPVGETDLVLFGDPKGGAQDTLGWYAAYKK